ncbi:MAG: patatin-like phospholipase family protein [Saprospiraceae bacterium]|nr:patatin-like phospholipase family protein [Saprospiraceae bacterium]
MLTKEDFTKVAEHAIGRLREAYGDQPPVVSDVVDAKGNQYVNLVQEGGGVLGVALVGYTYVLEQMGIRFMKMAGTSAGAINTLLLAAVGKKDEEKSLKILDILSKQNLFDFVDGDPEAKNLIKQAIDSKGFTQKLFRKIIFWAVVFFLSLLMTFWSIGYGFKKPAAWIPVLTLIISAGILWRQWRWVKDKRLKFYNSDYGINPGNVFTKWVEKNLADNGIHNLNDLNHHLSQVPEGKFKLRSEANNESLKDLNNPKPENFLVLVTSDITNKMKVEFPRMWNLYWDDAGKLNPAQFVRASMSVPIFFEPMIVSGIVPEKVLTAWKAFGGATSEADIKNEARFVDGGIISNFPINVFYNPDVAIPRLPTFGVMLDDEEMPENNGAPQKTTFKQYAGAMFSTLRSHYDKEFLIKNAAWKRTIGRIDVRGINWLNFNITDEEKLELFRRGAEAAADFLLGEGPLAPPAIPTPAPEFEGLESIGRSTEPPQKGFNWENYKAYRKEVNQELKKS